MRFVINVRVDNAAFEGDEREHELARILSELAERLSKMPLTVDMPIRLSDINGNRVGYAILEED
jgi:hypothetical protein